MVTIELTEAELMHLAADLQADMSLKIGPRLTAARKILDHAYTLWQEQGNG